MTSCFGKKKKKSYRLLEKAKRISCPWQESASVASCKVTFGWKLYVPTESFNFLKQQHFLFLFHVLLLTGKDSTWIFASSCLNKLCQKCLLVTLKNEQKYFRSLKRTYFVSHLFPLCFLWCLSQSRWAVHVSAWEFHPGAFAPHPNLLLQLQPVPSPLPQHELIPPSLFLTAWYLLRDRSPQSMCWCPQANF